MNNESYAFNEPSGGRAPQTPERAPAPPPNDTRLEVQGLSVYYGKTRAVNDVSLSIKTNKVTAIIGPSGCGKSTFIRCLNRMHEVTPGARVDGKVLLDGIDLYGPGTDPVKVRRKVGMVFQKPNPFPTMSIHDNVVAGFKLGGGGDHRT
ncbi:MAG TPA: ATP-binding cassette domain-containing protein, partial [Candidatus Binatia bacterium]